MNRRDFLKLGAGLAIGAALPALTRAEPEIKSSGAVAIGTITGGILTVGTQIHGTIKPGMRISGVGIDRDTFVLAEMGGPKRGTGTYAITLKSQFTSSQTLTFI
jgi:hypothetical protein